MRLNKKMLPREGVCAELTEEDYENETPRSRSIKAGTTADGKYQCRYCGLIFETLESHDEHYREVHGETKTYLKAENQS
jgi:rubredoxin